VTVQATTATETARTTVEIRVVARREVLKRAVAAAAVLAVKVE
jgi:hypothetical protein